jgi:hypothetical protein
MKQIYISGTDAAQALAKNCEVISDMKMGSENIVHAKRGRRIKGVCVADYCSATCVLICNCL